MRNFLIFGIAFFGILIFSGSVNAQCPTQANVVTKTHTNISCFGANDGTITVDLADASTSEPYNFELVDLSIPAIVTLSVTEVENKPGRSVVYSNVPPGSYAVGFFKSGCSTLQITDSPFGFEITEPTEIIATGTITPDCGSGNGKIAISITGGVPPYTSIIWTGPTSIPNGTTSTAANLTAGNYSVTITDNTSCSITENYFVPVTTPANAGPPTGVTCGTNSFALSGNAFAAGEIGTWTGPAGVTFSPNANTPTATANNLAVGNNVLTWTITDAGFVCPGTSDNITVIYSDVQINGSSDVTLLCFGATTGTGTFTVTGGIAPYTYTLISNTAGATITMPPAGPTMSVSFTNAGAGVVTVRVQDASGTCNDQATITISQPASALALSTPSNFNLNCNGDTNATGTFTASGGTAPYTFTVLSNTTGGTTSTTANSLTYLNAGAGTISIQVQDNNSCTQTRSINVIAPAVLVLTDPGDFNLNCNGDTNGTGTFTASGGTAPYTFTVLSNNTGGTTSNTATAITYTNAGVGTISVRVQDSKGCQQTQSVDVIAPPILVLSNPGDFNLNCNGDTDGTGVFTASGGTAPYIFTVISNTTGGTTSTTATALTYLNAGAGTINIQVQDNRGCLQTQSINVIAPPLLVLSDPGDFNLNCNGDVNATGTFTASGGTAPYTFTVLSNTTGGTTSNTATTFTYLNAGSGTIDVQVQDNNGCIQTQSVDVIAPPALVLSDPGDFGLSCNGDTNGTGIFTASGGTAPYTFTVLSNNTGGTTSNTATTLTYINAGAGTISVRVQDSKGCQQTQSVDVIAPPALVLSSPGNINLNCNGDTDGTGTFTASGGTAPYLFTVLSNTTGGTTSSTATDITFINAGPGTINIQLQDNNGCIQTQSINVIAPTALVLSDPSDISLTCAGGNNAAGTFTASGGTAPYSFTVISDNTGATTSNTATTFDFTGGGPGTITVQVQDNNGCIQSQSVTVNPASNVVVTPGPTVGNATCSGIDDGSISGLTASGGNGTYLFSIDGGAFLNQTSFTGLAAGPHNISAQDGTGCTSPILVVTVGAATVIAFDLPVINTIPSTCGGNDATISVSNVTGGSGTYNYIINGFTQGTAQPASFVFTGLTAGTYQIQVEDNASGCRSALENVVIGNPSGCVLNCFAYTVVVDQTLTKRPSCNGGNDGVIALMVTGNPGNIEVSIIPSLAPTEIRPSGSTFIFSNLSEGTYQYQIFDGSNICVQPFTWNNAQDITASANSFQDSPCFGTPSGSAIIDATGSATGQYFYSVDGTAWTEFVPGNIVNNLPGNGTYNIRVGGTANDPCYDEVSVTINTIGTALLDTVYVSPVNGFPAVSFPESPTATRVIGIEESGAAPYEVRLQLVDPYGITPNPPFIIDWTVVDGTNPQSFIPQKQLDALYAGEYQLSLRDAVGCEKTYSFIIELDERIFIPNIFTPNKSDDLNKNFFIRNLPESGSKLQITDRWGKEVYTSNNYNPETLWDGGESPDGVYFYRLQIKGGKTYTGWVEILRGTKP